MKHFFGPTGPNQFGIYAVHPGAIEAMNILSVAGADPNLAREAAAVLCRHFNDDRVYVPTQANGAATQAEAERERPIS